MQAGKVNSSPFSMVRFSSGNTKVKIDHMEALAFAKPEYHYGTEWTAQELLETAEQKLKIWEKHLERTSKEREEEEAKEYYDDKKRSNVIFCWGMCAEKVRKYKESIEKLQGIIAAPEYIETLEDLEKKSKQSKKNGGFCATIKGLFKRSY